MNNLGHGTCLTGEEYDRKVIGLYEGSPSIPTKEQETQLAQQELYLAIDYRLGSDFPQDRREALWVIHQKLLQERKWIMLKNFAKWIFNRDGADIADHLISGYAKELDKAELDAFFED